MKTVLLVSNRLPDEPGGRAEKFETRIRLLEDRGWRVVIGYVNPTLSSMIPGVIRCLRLARREDVAVVNSVSNPPHLQLVGWIVGRVMDVPWLAEFRDPMVIHPDVPSDSMAYRLRAMIERLIVTKATMVVWDDGIQLPDDYFAERYSSVPSDRWLKLPPLGFEQSRFENATSEEFKQFTITYAGSFYEGWIEPYNFLEGLKQFLESTENREIRVQFFGDWNPAYQDYVDKAGITAVVHTHEFVPYEEIVPVLKGSDAMLYIGGDEPWNRLNIPSKIYDYIGARTPIIAIVDPAFRVAELIETYGLGIVVPPDEPDQVSEAIRRIQTNEFEYDPSEEVFEAFTRERKLDVFAAVLNAVADGSQYVPDRAGGVGE